jgi:prephenate dehydrogenase
MTTCGESTFESVIVISGVGLIGGSIAAAVRIRFPGTRIIGIGRSRERLSAAIAQGLLDEGLETITVGSIPPGCFGVVCLPVEQISGVARELLDAGCTAVTDAGSVKKRICAKLAGEPRFAGSHPIAGSEQSGFEHAMGDLFDGRICVVCPGDASETTLSRVTSFWQGIGMKIRQLSADEHDHILALTSHLPHILASVTAGCVPPEYLEYAGTGFRDTTRIAAGSGAIWTSILLENRDACLAAIDVAEQGLTAVREAIQKRDAGELREIWDRAARIRRAMEGTPVREN